MIKKKESIDFCYFNSNNLPLSSKKSWILIMQNVQVEIRQVFLKKYTFLILKLNKKFIEITEEINNLIPNSPSSNSTSKHICHRTFTQNLLPQSVFNYQIHWSISLRNSFVLCLAPWHEPEEQSVRVSIDDNYSRKFKHKCAQVQSRRDAGGIGGLNARNDVS